MAKSKYSGVIDKLPRSFGTEPAYQEKVEAVKQQILEPLEFPVDSNWVQQTFKSTVSLLLPFERQLVHLTGGQRYGSAFARAYRDLRWVKEQLEAHVSNVNLILEAHAQLMAEQFDVEGIRSMHLDDTGDSVRVQYEPQAKVNDREAFRLWCLREGLEHSLQLPWMTTNKIVKDRLVEGDEYPDGVTAEARTKFVLTKG